MNEVMFPRGPTSTKTRAPSSWSASIVSRKRTGPGPVLDQQLADRLGTVRGRARPSCTTTAAAGRRAHRQPREGRAQVLGEGREQRRVHGAVVGQLLAHQPLADRDLARPRGRCGLADEHRLVGAVVHREVQLAAGLAGDPAGARGVGADRQQHCRRHLVALGGVGVGGIQSVAEGRQPLVGLEVEGARTPSPPSARRCCGRASRRSGGTSRRITACTAALAVSTASTAMSSSISRVSVRRRSSSEKAGRREDPVAQQMARAGARRRAGRSGRTQRGPRRTAGTARRACSGTARPRRGTRTRPFPRGRGARAS